MQEPFTLTTAQQRIFYMQQKYPRSPLFYIGGTVTIQGTVDPQRLQAAIERLCRTHDALRIQLVRDGSKVMQHVTSQIPPIDLLDFTRGENPKQDFACWGAQQASTMPVLFDRPLAYFAVAVLPQGHAAYYVRLHHLIADGWSMQLLTKQIESFYGQEGQAATPAPSFAAYARGSKEQTWNDADENYWTTQYLSPVPAVPAPEGPLQGARKSHLLSPQRSQQVRHLCERWQIGLAAFFTGLLCLLLYKAQGREDVVIGHPLLGRNGRQQRRTFGTFVNPMPFRMQVDGGQSLADYFTQVAVQLRQNAKHQSYPFNALCGRLGLGREGARLYRICLNYYNTALPETFQGMPVENQEFYNGEQEYDLQLIIRPWRKEQLQIDADYRLAAITEEQIDRLFDSLERLIDQFLAGVEQVGRCSLLTPEQEQRVLAHSRGPQQAPVTGTAVDQIVRNAARFPTRTAVSFQRKRLRYADLVQRAMRFACLLQKRGVKKGDIVAALLPHRIESVTAALGIWIAGGVLLPLDRHQPAERNLALMRRGKASFLIACADDWNLDQGGPEWIDLDAPLPESAALRAVLPEREDAAYLIFTSGSTGMPKGIFLTHANLLHYLHFAAQHYCKSDRECTACYASFAFDFSLTSLWMPLILGGEVRIYAGGREKNVYQEIIAERRVTILKLTPSQIPLLLDHAKPDSAVHTLLLGGEALRSEDCRRLYEAFGGRVGIVNEYGPTEATVGCIVHWYRAQKEYGDAVPIGRAIPNMRAYLLDRDGRPVPDGVQGELFLAGEGLARGYLDPQQTLERFLPDPWETGERMYKTGDRAVRTAEGELIYCGRVDEEVKIRGYRVCPQELESCALQSGLVQAAAAYADRQGEQTVLRLAVRLREGQEEQTLFGYLSRHLPDYLLPQAIDCLPALPLTANAKIDYAALKDRLHCPTQEKEKRLADERLLSCAAEVLGQSVRGEDNFYAMGGDSIKAIQLSSRMEEAGCRLEVSHILRHPDFWEMSTWIGQEHERVQEVAVSTEIGSTPALCWFEEQHFSDPGMYGQTVFLHLKQHVTRQEVEQALTDLVARHEMLRAHLDPAGRLVVGAPRPVRVETASLPVAARFDLSRDLFIKAFLEGNRLQLSLHHWAVDGLSMRILLEDFARALTGVRSHKPARFPQKTASFQTYAQLLADKAAGLTPGGWGEGGREPHVILSQTSSAEFEMDAQRTDRIFKSAQRAYALNTQELLLSALAQTASQLAEQRPVVIMVEGHGRDAVEGLDVSRTVGWFTTQYPVEFPAVHGMQECLIAHKECYRKVAQRGADYGLARYLRRLPVRRDAWIRFNYLGEIRLADPSLFSLESVPLCGDCSAQNTMPCLLDVTAAIQENRLLLRVCMAPQLAGGAQKFGQQMLDLLEQVGEHCLHKTAMRTPSDFPLVSLTQDQLQTILEDTEDVI